jgi:hypothetical protein
LNLNSFISSELAVVWIEVEVDLFLGYLLSTHFFLIQRTLRPYCTFDQLELIPRKTRIRTMFKIEHLWRVHAWFLIKFIGLKNQTSLMTFEVTDNPMNLHLLSFNHALRTYFDFTKIWANTNSRKFFLLPLHLSLYPYKQFNIPILPFYYLTSPLQKKFNTHKFFGKLMLSFPVANIRNRNTWKMCSKNYNHKPIMS